MRVKDPTAWMDDLTVFVSDEEITETAALLEPDLLHSGSKWTAAAWLGLVAIVGGSFAAVTLSPGIRDSAASFAAYIVVAILVLKGLRPLTRRIVGGAIVWPASMTFFWAALASGIAVLTAFFDSAWLAYGLSAFGGFFVGMMHGSLNPNHVRNEDAWMMASLPLGIVCTVSATW